MRMKFVLGLVVVMSIIVSSIAVSALNAPSWKLNDLRGESYKSFNSERYNLLYNKDKNICNKGMILGRMSDGSYMCVWPGSNKHKEKIVVISDNNVGGVVDDQDNSAEDNDEEQDSEEDGDEDTCGGDCSQGHEGGCEGNDKHCETEEKCEEVREKVWKKSCEFKRGRVHCDYGWVWQTREVCHVELVCEDMESD